MEKNEAIAWFGSQRKLADFLGVAQSNVSAWKKIPKHHQKTIEEHTKGGLVASVDRTKMTRYMCTIEKFYLDMLKADADSLGLTVVEVLRRAIKNYHNKISGKEL